VVCEQADGAEAEIAQDLRADAGLVRGPFALGFGDVVGPA
jgi:hypothetical protein